ncbi:hypothetical protein GCM10007160_22280 [Litchfieldella qijiaojingensis]|uniref:DUF1439 domain-containing protein n=1 Tax=Litchfieldella qijiaojingensis TaxID=980347 RepID=A0ABQ2YW00_9GAMM|nr:hypothetical protein [Halomonas qijiaojingensis]GGX94218.1 hypothetical protein GCM10007160_22280 [Halomonas qijiaojingensis]
MPNLRSPRSYLARWRLLAPWCLALLLSGCLALPQTGLFAMRLAVTSLGIEDVRIGPYTIRAGLDTSDITSLIASSLGLGSLPIQATLTMGLGLPSGLPPVEMNGFAWILDVPGAETITGRYTDQVALTPGDDANLRLPVAFDALGDGQRLAPMVQLASQLATRGELPAGSELSITPGGLRGLGVNLPAGLWMPTVRLAVGEDGSLEPQT